MPKVKAVLMVIILLSTSIPLFHGYDEAKLDPNNAELQNKNDLNALPDEQSVHGTRGTRNGANLIENNDHGGSWVDTFKDKSGVDWGQSFNAKIHDENAIINLSYYYDPNTVARWHFEEPSGSTVYDETANDNDGTIYGGASRVTGKFGKCLSFDGSNDRIDVPDSTSLSITGQITISAWVNFSSLPSSGRNYCIVKKRISASDSYQLFIRDDGKVRFTVDTGAVGTSITGTTALNDNNWRFIAGTWDQSNLKLYVDGISDATAVSLSGSMSNTADKLAMGYHTSASNPSSWNYYNGRLDDVWISKIARSALEIKSIYENGTPTNLRSAYLYSKPINIPIGKCWDTLIINKTQANNHYLNITILNATNNQQIPGTPKYINNGEFDISNIDPEVYPTIRLRADFSGNSTSSPTLHYWGISWNASSAWRDTLFGDFKGTGVNQNYGDGELWLKTFPTDFVKYSSNPLVKNGPATSWDDVSATRPAIVYNGTGYMMWYEGRPGSTSWQIGLATSTDGITWTKYSGNPVLTLGSGSAWDSDVIGMPWVLFDGKKYKMWYGGELGTTWKIGYATSIDGINWQKYPNNPVLDLGSSGSWDDAEVKDPFVLFDGGMYKMWYTGMKNSNHVNKVGYAISYDGINWTKHSNNPIISGPSGWNLGIRSMHILPEFNNYLGWFTNRGGQMEIYYTHSTDGVSWDNYINNPILQKGPSGTWDDSSVLTSRIIKNDKQYWMYYAGSDGTNHQIGLAKSKFGTTGEFTSNTITIPPKCYYDKLIINKTEPTGTYINVSILDAATQQNIIGFENIHGTTYDISKISPITHPSIILKAKFESNGLATPILYDWSVNWLNNFPPIIENISAPQVVNRTFTVPIKINLSDQEEEEWELTLDVDYQSPTDTDWVTEYLSTPTYVADHLVCNFTPPAEAELGLYAFRFRCNDSSQGFDIYPELHYIRVRNNDPIIWNVSLQPPSAEVNRTMTRKLVINTSDIETSQENLVIDIKYKSALDATWQQLQNKIFKDGYWEVDFTPPKFADLGPYTFNITCNDSLSENFQLLNLHVLNNLPTPPDVLISPDEPITLDDLSVELNNANDIETPNSNLEYWYRWYKDNFYLAEFENATTISHTETVKGEVWRCVVFVHDGDDLGASNYAETTILNSPPVLVEKFNTFELDEDTIAILQNKLQTIFKDYDNDLLSFKATGQENITVEITEANGTIKFIPSADWFGTEAVTFYANDSSPTEALETVLVTVKPVNDLPRITQVGAQSTSITYSELEFMVNQDEWLNLTIQVEDIDGDAARGMIAFIHNISERDNLFFDNTENKIVFHPTNNDVGWHYFNITITDNNETPLEYISQHIRIRVVNANDPPTVKIIIPVEGQEFQDSDKIILTAEAEDIDLIVWNSNERLNFRWSSDAPEFSVLGAGEKLENITLPPGEYNITVEVTDNDNAKAYDHVHIVVKAPPEDEPTELFSSYLFLLLLIILIIIIIIICVLLFVYSRKRKREKEAQAAPAGQVLQPDAAYLPSTGAPGQLAIVKSPQLSPPQVIRGVPLAAAPTSQPPAQLPPFQPGPSVTATEETPQEKLKLLEQRLLHGEIDQELYESLKVKYELEAKPYQPPPQLPPATSPTVTTPTPAVTQPIPTPTITQPQPQPQQQPTQTPQPQQPQPTRAPIPVKQPTTPPTPQPQAQDQLQPSPQPQQQISPTQQLPTQPLQPQAPSQQPQTQTQPQLQQPLPDQQSQELQPQIKPKEQSDGE
ncbi:LamG-like jellyroll fold domain-containing protein [[Eubacterium] cellulosolvens]